MGIEHHSLMALLDAGKSHAEAAAALSASSVRAIAISDLENWLDRENLAERGVTGAWEGPLIDLIGNPAYPVELRNGVADLFKHINKPRSTAVDTADPLYAQQAAKLLTGLTMVGALTADQRAAFIMLGGGLRHVTPVTEADVVEHLAERAALDAHRSLIDELEQALGKHVNRHDMAATRASLVADVHAAADDLEAGGN